MDLAKFGSSALNTRRIVYVKTRPTPSSYGPGLTKTEAVTVMFANGTKAEFDGDSACALREFVKSATLAQAGLTKIGDNAIDVSHILYVTRQDEPLRPSALAVYFDVNTKEPLIFDNNDSVALRSFIEGLPNTCA